MLKNVLILFISDFMEIIHVQLSDKGREVTVSEVDRKDLLLKAINIKNCEVGPLLVPDHYL